MIVYIWGKQNCKVCNQAKALCDQESLTYQYFELDKDFTREELLEKFPEAKTFPQIMLDDFHVGGYTDLKKHLKQ